MVLAACAGSRVHETVVVTGAEADLVRADAVERNKGRHPQGIRFAINEGYERGQTSSLKTGLEALSRGSDGFMVLPVDHPLVTSTEINALIDRFESKPRGRTIFIATYDDKRGHPVLFASGHRSALLALGDDEPLHDYTRVRSGEIELVAVENSGVVRGMNTPQEYEELLAAYRARHALGETARP